MAEPSIAIVGAGPVGALIALELANKGLRPILLDRRSDISWTSRAICISRRSLEILDRAGVGGAFAAKALPWSKGKTFHRDRLVFQLVMPQGPGDRRPPFVNLQQCYTERFLIDAIEALGERGPELRWGHELTTFVQHEKGARLAINANDSTYDLEADWVVAADGARSAVRTALGLPLRGTSYEGRYLISDIEVEDADWPIERHVWFDAPANPGSTVILHVQPDGIWRIDLQLRDDEDADQVLRDENLLPRLQAQLDMIGVTARWRLVWKSLYRAHALSLDDYRHGRTLFAGDAAHLVPIFGVRGLNSGFDDAHNLAWKLARVARGEAPEALLDSYSSERRRATAENLAYATRSTWFMSPPTAGFRTMRDAALILAHDHEWASSLINPRQATFHVYDDSPIVCRDGIANGVVPGAPVPDLPVRLASEETTGLHVALASDDFSLLIFADFIDSEAITTAQSACRAMAVKTVLIASRHSGERTPDVLDEGAVATRFDAGNFPFYLVRPDEHVTARMKSLDAAVLRSALDVGSGCGHAPERSRMPEAQASPLERIYESLSLAIDAASDRHDKTFLPRLALALARELGDAERVERIVAETSAAEAGGG